jgi:GT2 family glycosyltransferase
MVEKIGVVILNWNGWQMTLATVNSLRQTNEPEGRWRIFVVDNGSTDDSIQHLQIEPDIKLIVLSENRGFAAGNNVGIRHALEEGCNYILLLNNDVILDPEFLGPLLQRLVQISEAWVISPKIHFADPPNRIWYAGGNFRYPRLIGEMVGLNQEDKGQFDSPKIVDFVTGCCMLVKAAAFQQIGLLDEDFFFYQEDVDFSHRVTSAGYQVWYEPYSLVWHAVSSSTANLSPWRTFLYAESRMVFFGKHIKGIRWVPVIGMEVTRLCRTVLTNLVQGRPAEAVSYVRGVWSGVKLIRVNRKTKNAALN